MAYTIIIMAYTAAFPQSGSLFSVIQAISASHVGQAAYSLHEVVWVPHIELAETGSLGQWVNIHTQGRRVL